MTSPDNAPRRSASPRDSARTRVYAAEALVLGLFDRASSNRIAEIAGTQLTLPAEAMFASVDAVREHVARIVAMPSVRAEFPRAAVPVSVRARRGFRAAEYRPTLAEIAVPVSSKGRWAMRELVVLHEVAHHLDDSGGPAHGPGFVRTLIEVAGLVLGPEAALVYRVIFADSGALG